MSERLAELVASVFERSEIDEVDQLAALDEFLAELVQLARTDAIAGLIDDLLDYRLLVGIALPDRDVVTGRDAVAA